MFGASKIVKTRFELDSQGCKLRGFILRPHRTGRFPAVIVSHGFASCTRDTKKYARVFVDEGYTAVCFDFCMSGCVCQRKSSAKGHEKVKHHQHKGI